MATITYAAPRTCAELMCSTAFIRLIAGPVGSGKTTACILELFRRASEQDQAPDGYRYTRFAILRQTLSQLKMTILKDVLQWLQGISTWKVSENTIFVECGDIRSEWILLPLDEPEDQRRLLSSQLTGAWISEGIEIDIELVDAIAGRCARYPGPLMGGCTWAGIIIDTNMPEEGTPWHTAMVEVPQDWAVFIQPGGLDPLAENLPWLLQTKETLKLPVNDPVRIAQGRKYYERLARGRSPAWVKRYVHAKYGTDPSGTAVFAETFRPTSTYQPGMPWHVVDNLEPVYGATLLIGQDFGRDPCAALGQVDGMGRLLILDEVEALKMGLEMAVAMRLRPKLMQPRYAMIPMCIVGDPAGIAKNNISEETSFDFLRKCGFNAFPAPTNDLDPRIRAVEHWLLGSRATGPAMLIDRGRCPNIIRALRGGYRFGNTPEGELKPKPIKNESSHYMDALQYICMCAMGAALGLINRQLMRPKVRRGGSVPSSAGWT